MSVFRSTDIRYSIVSEALREAKEAAAEITEAAGGPMKSACDLDVIFRKGLTDMVDSKIAKLRGKIEMAAHMINDSAATTLKNAAPNMFTALKYPGAKLHTNGVEGIIRDNIVTHNRKIKGPFSNWKAANNFSVNQTFAATCKRIGVSVYAATIRMSQDPDYDIFSSGIPPPIMANCQRPAKDSTRP